MKLTSLLSRKKLLLTSITIMFLVSATIVTVINATSASPETPYFHVDPPEVRDVQPSKNFTITINVTDAPPSYAWEVYLNWDPALLNVSDIEEGDWLHRWDPNPFPPPPAFPKYTTNLAYTPLDEASLQGEILVTCTLVGNLSMVEWASGDGWLSTLSFTVNTIGETPLNLTGTRLWDHMDAGYPAPTPYVNLDGFFSNLLPPIADFTYTSPVANTTVDFTSTSYDPDGLITEWKWDLNGDGTFDTFTENATYTYTEAKNYNVTLDVTDNDGLTGTKTVTLTVFPEVIHNVAITNVTPSATEAVLGEEITITVVAKNKGSETETFNVTVYYNNTAIGMQNVTNLASGSNTTLTFTWNTTDAPYGLYTISANTSVLEGETQTDDNTFIDGTITLLSQPVAEFTENATTVLTDELINFDASSSDDPDGMIASYFWDFGDGTNATGVTVDHAYTDDGTYTVTLTVTDNDDLTDSTTATKTVSNRPPVASFTEDETTVNTGDVIHFDASESSDDDGVIASYFWDFGDGTNATGVTVDHAYTDDGTYTVTLTVTDNDGATDSTTATKTVKAPSGLPLGWYAAIGLGIAALITIALYILYRRRKE